MIRVNTNSFAHCRSIYLPDKPLHPLQPGDRVLLRTWKIQGPEQQSAKQETYDVLMTTHSSLKLTGIKPWTHHTRIKRVPPQGNLYLAAAVDTYGNSGPALLKDI